MHFHVTLACRAELNNIVCHINGDFVIIKEFVVSGFCSLHFHVTLAYRDELKNTGDFVTKGFVVSGSTVL